MTERAPAAGAGSSPCWCSSHWAFRAGDHHRCAAPCGCRGEPRGKHFGECLLCCHALGSRAPADADVRESPLLSDHSPSPVSSPSAICPGNRRIRGGQPDRGMLPPGQDCCRQEHRRLHRGELRPDCAAGEHRPPCCLGSQSSDRARARIRSARSVVSAQAGSPAHPHHVAATLLFPEPPAREACRALSACATLPRLPSWLPSRCAAPLQTMFIEHT